MSNHQIVLEKYKHYMEEWMLPYNSLEEYEQYFGRVPKFRYHTLKCCFDHFFENDFKTIVELGTSRSFVDGKFPGCNEDDRKYWEPNNPDKWDWGAGFFTRLTAEIIKDTDIEFLMTPIEHTAQLHLREAKLIVERDIISDNGILLIDDVRNPTPKIIAKEESDYGKAKYSIPYLQENGFELVMDEYQVVMIKK